MQNVWCKSISQVEDKKMQMLDLNFLYADNNHKIQKFQTAEKFAVIILKFEQYGFTIE